MKKIISGLTSVLLIWGILVAVEYYRSYKDNTKFLVNLETEVTDEYTKRVGLGYSYKSYVYDVDTVSDGTVVKEFSIFKFVISKEIAVREKK